MKIIITTSDDTATQVLKAIELVQTVSGKEIEIEIQFDPITTIPPVVVEPEPLKRGPKPSVQYRAIADASVIDAIGAHTIEGIIFDHLLHNGPCTEKAIREAKFMKRKTVESALHRLKHMSVVRPESIATGEAIEVKPK